MKAADEAQLLATSQDARFWRALVRARESL